MIYQSVLCLPPDPRRFSAFVTLMTPPQRFGERTFFSDHLVGRGEGAEPVLHVNKVRPVTLPFEICRVERHPRADQTFIPLDVQRYLVIVMPSDTAGNPVPTETEAFILPGTVGVIYHANVWHAGAAVLHQSGNFAVLMRRRGDDGDDEFRSITPLLIEDDGFQPAYSLQHTNSKDRE